MIGSVRYDGIEPPIDLHDPFWNRMFLERSLRYDPSGHSYSRTKDTICHGDLPGDFQHRSGGSSALASPDEMSAHPLSPTEVLL